MARGQTLEAIEAFSGALTLKPDSMIARLMRGETYRQRGEFSSAVRDLTEAAALDPTAPRPLELLGDAHAAMGQHQAAAIHYDRSLRLDDRAPRVVYKLGLAHYRSGDILAGDRRPSSSGEPRRSPGAGALPARFLPPRSAASQSGRARAAPGRGARSQLGGRTRRARHALHRFRTAAAGHRATRGALGARAERDRSDSSASGWPTRRLGRTMPPSSRSITQQSVIPTHPSSTPRLAASGSISPRTNATRRPCARRLKSSRHSPSSRTRRAKRSRCMAGPFFCPGNLAAAEYELRRATEQFPIEPVAFTYLATAATRLGHLDAAQDAEAKLRALVGG